MLYTSLYIASTGIMPIFISTRCIRKIQWNIFFILQSLISQIYFYPPTHKEYSYFHFLQHFYVYFFMLHIFFAISILSLLRVGERRLYLFLYASLNIFLEEYNHRLQTETLTFAINQWLYFRYL